MVSLIGLVSFLPVLLLALPAGRDRRPARPPPHPAAPAIGAEIVVAALLTDSGADEPRLGRSRCCCCRPRPCSARARSYFAPASSRPSARCSCPAPLLPARHRLEQSLAWQTASIAGPAVGGVLVAISPGLSYGVAARPLSSPPPSAWLLIRGNAQPEVQPGSRWALMKEGLAYVWTNKIVFGAISLDLAAVILAGATAACCRSTPGTCCMSAPEGFGFLRAGLGGRRGGGGPLARSQSRSAKRPG
jgi:hypothetical protein